MASSTNAEELKALLAGLSSAEDTIRKNAEAAFENAQKTNPSVLCRTLMDGVRGAADFKDRQLASVFLRRALRDFERSSAGRSIWDEMDSATQEYLKQHALEALANESEVRVLQSVRELLITVAYGLFNHRVQWPQLGVGLTMLCNAPDAERQASALYTLSALSSYIPEFISADATSLSDLIITKLAAGNATNVRVSALDLYVELVSCAADDDDDDEDEEEELQAAGYQRTLQGQRAAPFSFEPAGEEKQQEILRGVIQLCTDLAGACVASPERDEPEQQLIDVLGKLVDIAMADPDMVKKHQNELLQVMLLIAREGKLSEDVRCTAAEFLITYAEQKPRTVAAVPGLVTAVVRCLMEFLLEHDEDEQCWLTRELMSEDDEDSRLMETGETGLDRFAAALEGEVVMPVVFEVVAAFLQEQRWEAKAAAMIAVGQTIEFLPEERVNDQLDQVIDLVLAQCTSPHYKVRYYAFRALAQTALDHRPVAQEKGHAKCLPVIIQAMDDQVARVQAQAFATFVNFAEEVDVEDLEPYIEGVMEKILFRMSGQFALETDKQMPEDKVAAMHRSIREQVVTSIAVISGVLEDRFGVYVPRVLPLMMTIAEQTAGSKPDRHMQGRAWECLSVMVLSLGHRNLPRESFSIAERLVSIYSVQHRDDNTESGSLKEYVFEALKRMIQALDGDFAPLVPTLVPTLLGHLKYEVVQVDASNMQDYRCVYTGEPGTGLSGVKTSAIEIMEQSVTLLTTLATGGCAAAMVAHAEPIARAVTPLLSMEYSEAVSRGAIGTYASLLEACRTHHPQGVGIAQLLLREPLKVILGRCATEESGGDVTDITWSLTGLARCIEGAGDDVLTEKELEDVMNAIHSLIVNSSRRMKKLTTKKNRMSGKGAAAAAPGSADAEEVETLEETIENEQVYRETCIRMQEAMLKTHKQLGMKVIVPKAISFACAHFNDNGNDRVLAATICGDLVEHLKEVGYNLLKETPDLLSALLNACHDSNAWARQAACFAISLIFNLPSTAIDAAIVTAGCERLVGVVQHAEAKNKENREATDNAVSGLVAAVLYQKSHLPQPTVDAIVTLVLDNLPLEYDEIEAQKAHKAICKSLMEDSCAFWGANRENVGKVLKLLAQLYKRAPTLAEDEDSIDKLILAVVSAIGLPTVAQYVSAGELSHVQVRGFRKLQRDITRATAAATGTPAAGSP